MKRRDFIVAGVASVVAPVLPVTVKVWASPLTQAENWAALYGLTPFAGETDAALRRRIIEEHQAMGRAYMRAVVDGALREMEAAGIIAEPERRKPPT